MLHRDIIILKKILDEISISIKFMDNVTREDFISDELLKRAVGMTVINIGELVKNLSVDMREKYGDIPWKQISGFRDITAHKYGTLNMNDVYITVINDFPELKTQIESILSNN